jgi:hypothetical protein
LNISAYFIPIDLGSISIHLDENIFILLWNESIVIPLGGVVWGSFEKEACLFQKRLTLKVLKISKKLSHQMFVIIPRCVDVAISTY